MLLPIVLEKTKLLPIYVIGMGIKEHQTRKYREQGFAGFQLLYCTSGSGVFVIEGKEFIIECGDAFFFRPEVPHEYYPTSDIWKTRWVAFLGSSAANIMDYLDFGNYEVFKLSHFEEFDIQMNALWDMFWCDEPDKEIKTSMLMYKMIIKMGDCKNSQTLEGDLNQNQKYEKLRPVINMIKEKYCDDLGLKDMAEVIGISPNHLCRLFSQVYQTTPLKYFTHFRLSMAKYYLSSQKELQIKEVSELVGFHNCGYFCTVFKKSEGITPDEFRKINAF